MWLEFPKPGGVRWVPKHGFGGLSVSALASLELALKKKRKIQATVSFLSPKASLHLHTMRPPRCSIYLANMVLLSVSSSGVRDSTRTCGLQTIYEASLTKLRSTAWNSCAPDPKEPGGFRVQGLGWKSRQAPSPWPAMCPASISASWQKNARFNHTAGSLTLKISDGYGS